ncbi:Hsp20/alpha crystallin family protein, partial [Cupriavidus lacunae]|uniref:Hsp20/alpha crystallin family protein n=1 Tax=Cupriavidus lacunae TaxID=2666307 RepID=UPI001FC94526
MSDNTAVTKQGDTGSTEAALMPPVNVYEDAAGITLYADLPGVPKDNLVVQVQGDILTIKGEVVLDLAEGMEASYAEVSLPRYRRVFTLSKELLRFTKNMTTDSGLARFISNGLIGDTRRVEEAVRRCNEEA